VDFSLLNLPDQDVQTSVVTWNETGLLALDGLAAAAPAEARPLLVPLKPNDRTRVGFRIRLLEFGLHLLAVFLDGRLAGGALAPRASDVGQSTRCLFPHRQQQAAASPIVLPRQVELAGCRHPESDHPGPSLRPPLL